MVAEVGRPNQETQPSGRRFRMAAFGTALALAAVSASFSISGLTAIFQGATLAVIVMGAVLELGKLVSVAWLGAFWRSSSLALRTVLVAMVAVLMAINAVGVFGSLSRATSNTPHTNVAL